MSSQAPVSFPSDISRPSIEDGDTTIVLSPLFLQYVVSSHYHASVERINKDFSLKQDDLELIADLDRMVMADRLSLEEYVEALKDELRNSVPPARFSEFVGRLLAERFVPLGDLIQPTALETAHTLEIVLPPTPYYRMYRTPLTYSGAATEIATMAGFSLVGGLMRERLRELVLAKQQGRRVEAQIRDVLTRGLDFGGLGLDQQMAERVIVAMNDLLGRVELMSEDQYAEWLTIEARRRAVVGASDPEREDDAPPIPKVASNQSSVRTQLEAAIEAAMLRIEDRPMDEYLDRRLRSAISSRLRDVRSLLELRQLCLRDVKVGGLGLDEARADAIVKNVEEVYREFHEPIAQEERSKIERQHIDQEKKVEQRRKRESEEHAQWFEQKVRARQVEEAEAARFKERFGGNASSAVHPVQAEDRRIETQKFGSLVPAPAVSVQSNPHASSTIDADPKLAHGGNFSPTTAPVVRVSAATVEAASTAAVRPTLDDVTRAPATPRLVGLVDELHQMTLAEFRRLASDPEQAVMKIRQRIDTLAQESFERKVEGIRALQASPLQNEYLRLVAESFREKKPVTALAEERRRGGSEGMSPDEIGSIINLNSTLHF